MSAQTNQQQEKLNVVELFAGVGGFRLGLEAVHSSPFEVTLSNQFEPSRKKQHASDIYRAHWAEQAHINEDIFKLLESEAGQQAVRNAQPDVLVGGFPCQDYSVAKPLSSSDGLAGKKGVLWWSIAKLLRQRLDDGEPRQIPRSGECRPYPLVPCSLPGTGLLGNPRNVKLPRLCGRMENYQCGRLRSRTTPSSSFHRGVSQDHRHLQASTGHFVCKGVTMAIECGPHVGIPMRRNEFP